MDDRPREIAVAIEQFRRARFALGLRCPRCSSSDVIRWGSFSARQRYRCRTCSRTFSDLTGTPAAHLKKVELLRGYARCLAESAPIRRAARSIGVAPSTAFRWRHRLAGALAISHQETLEGWIELVARRFPESFKGQRRLPRPPRRRGPDPAKVPARQVSVIVAMDRTSSLVTALIPQPTVGSSDLMSTLAGRLTDRPIVVAAEGRFGAASIFARRAGGTFRDARWPAHPRNRSGMERIAEARAYATRMGDWIRRFRGVATKYLPNYLAWHRALDYIERKRIEERVLRWPMTSTAAANSSREQSPRGAGPTHPRPPFP